MQGSLFLCAALLVTAQAIPNGYYHQQYQYQQSSSKFKNDELQHKSEDEGFYSKQGDLQGQQEPKVNEYESHLEFTNPKLKSGSEDLTQQTEDVFAQQGIKNHHGGSHRGRGHYGHGYRNHGGRISSDSDSYDFGSSGNRRGYTYSGSFSVGGSNANVETLHPKKTYGVNSNLIGLAQTLQNDLSRQLQEAITKQHRESSYSHSYSSSSAQMDADLQRLEEELQRNLTQQLQTELQKKYGTQGNRGSYSYTITTGNYNPQANYENQELTDLTQQLQDNLKKQLQEGVRTEYRQSSHSSSSSSSSNVYDGSQRPSRVDHKGKPSRYGSNNGDIDEDANSKITRTHGSTRTQTTHLTSSHDTNQNTDDSNTRNVYVNSYGNRPTDTVDSDSQTVDSSDTRRTTYGGYNAPEDTNTNTQTAGTRRTTYVRNQHGSTSYAGSNVNQQTEDFDTSGTRGTDYPNRPLDSDSQTRRTYVVRTQVNGGTDGTHQTRPDVDDVNTNTQTSQTHRTTYGSSSYAGAVNQQRPTHGVNYPNKPSYTVYKPSRPSDDNEDIETVYDTQRGTTFRVRGTTSKIPSETEEIETFVGSNRPTNTYTGGSRSQTTYTASSDADVDAQQVLVEPDSYNYKPTSVVSTYDHSRTQTVTEQKPHTYPTRIYRPVVRPQIALSVVIKRVEDDLLSEVNTAYIQDQIRSQQQKYPSNQNQKPDYDTVIAQLTSEFKRKLAQKVEEELRNTYGTQEQYGSFSYSVSSSNPQQPITANYKLDDLTDLKQQVEDNLTRKVTDSVKQEQRQYSQTHYSTFSSYQTHQAPVQDNSQSFSKYDTFTGNQQTGNTRPAYSVGGTQGNRQISYTFNTNGRNTESDSQLNIIGNELQQQLQRQLQEAITKQQQQWSASHSTSSVQGSQGYQVQLEDLTEELKRNLTRQLQESLSQHYGKQGQRGGYSYTITTGGDYNSKANYDNQKLTDLKKQLESDLVRQLENSLSQQSSFSQYNTHASSSNLKPTIHVNPVHTTTNSHGGKTYTVSGSAYMAGSVPAHKFTSTGTNSGFGSSFTEDCLQDEPTTPIVQGKPASGSLLKKQDDEQKTVDEDLGQRTIDDLFGDQQQVDVGQIGDDGDLNQKTEDGFGKLTVGQKPINDDSQKLINNEMYVQKARQVDASNTQKVEDLSQVMEGQKTDLTQQLETGFGPIEVNSQLNSGKHTSQTITTQQQVSGHQATSHSSGSSYHGQQTEDFGQQTEELGQQTEDDDYIDADLTQQTEDGFGKLEVGGQSQLDLSQHTEDLTQQVEDGGFGALQVGSNQQSNSNNAGRVASGHNYHSSSSSSSSNSYRSGSYSTGRQIHVSEPHESADVSETVADLEQQQIEKHIATPTTHGQDSHAPQKTSDVVESVENNDGNTETTTAKAGFWSRVGSKIEGSYNTAKDKAKSIFSAG